MPHKGYFIVLKKVLDNYLDIFYSTYAVSGHYKIFKRGLPMKAINVDDEVYEFIRQKAEPFIDKTENDVLRKLFLKEKNIASSTKSASTISPREILEAVAGPHSNKEQLKNEFIARFLQEKFTGKFRIRPPYHMMYESNDQIVYFQNFNEPDRPNLWFRLMKKPLDVMRSSGKKGYVCLTVPPEGYAFRIPLMEIEDKILEAKWERKDYEVNINPADSKWRELSWSIEGYKVFI
jgi:hypothetical protein